MKLRHAAALALGIWLTGCAALTDQSAAQIDHAARAECGAPSTAATSPPVRPFAVRFPLSDRCIELLREDGAPELFLSMARERSDLTIAMWRACPSENPCSQLSECQLLRRALESGSKAAQDIAITSCENAQKADYSCRSLQSDPAYQTQSRALKACLESPPPECNQPSPRLSPSATHEAWERWNEANIQRLNTCLCVSLGADDNSDECRGAVSRYNQGAERWTAMSTSNNPASAPGTIEPSSASGSAFWSDAKTVGLVLLKALPAAAAAGMAAGSGGQYPEPAPEPQRTMPTYTQCHAWGNQIDCNTM